MKPQSANSFSRRSVIPISVGHFMSTPPSSVGKECTGRPSTMPPDSAPRMRAHQPYILNERVMLVAIEYAALVQTYLVWSAPEVSSSKLNSSTGEVLAPYGK